MGDVVNLRTMRKRAVRQRNAEVATGKRAVYGRSKSDRNREAAQGERSSKLLDQHRLETGDDR